MRVKRFSFCMALLISAMQSNAQLTIQPLLPQAGLIRRAQLMDMTAVYLKDDQPLVTVEIQLRDRLTGQALFSAKTNTVLLKKGVNVWNASMLEPLVYTGTSLLKDNGTGLMPVGIYEVCYRVVTADLKTELVDNECQVFDAEAMAPPMLSFPEDSAKIEKSYPVFQWLPPTPVSVFPDLNYEIIVSPIYAGQSALEAIERNSPIFSAGGIRQNVMEYPSSYSMPEAGKYYAWQIIARNGENFGAKSEAWLFTVNDLEKPEDLIPPAMSYIKLSKGIFDAVYTPAEELKFEFANEKLDNTGIVQIYQIKKEGKVIIAKEELSLVAGQNFISWKAKLPQPEQKEQILILRIDMPSGDSWGCQLRIPKAN